MAKFSDKAFLRNISRLYQSVSLKIYILKEIITMIFKGVCRFSVDSVMSDNLWKYISDLKTIVLMHSVRQEA